VKNAKKQEMVVKLIALHKHCTAYTAMSETIEFNYDTMLAKQQKAPQKQVQTTYWLINILFADNLPPVGYWTCSK
jgi:hypothetical protein